MRKCSFVVALALLAAASVPAAFAQKRETNPLPRHMPTKARYVVEFARPGGGGSNLSYHGGPTITNARVTLIFWGPDFASGGKDYALSQSLTSYVTNFGTTTHYAVITQYDGPSGVFIQSGSLGGTAIYDTSTPPTNVTDAIVQGEVSKVTNQNPDSSTIYEVFLPSESYSSDGTRTSCGGPNLYYCAYHGNFSLSGIDTKYAAMPYPSCGGCQSSGFSTTQNFEHFISHETREAVTDEDGNAWFDRRGYEADDKCAWSPAPFIDSNGFAYQYEWSNAASGCVK